jgi:uncharacterized membrane protein (UPF0136 family)
MAWLNVVLVIYALIMLLGGVGAYFATQSSASMIAGVVSAVLLLGSAALAKSHPKVGYGLAAMTSFGLLVLFLGRYWEGRSMMTLMLALLAAVMLIVIGAGAFAPRR